jgi:hypothetical protein
MPEQDEVAYEAPVVEELSVEEGPASVQAGTIQQTNL